MKDKILDKLYAIFIFATVAMLMVGWYDAMTPLVGEDLAYGFSLFFGLLAPVGFTVHFINRHKRREEEGTEPIPEVEEYNKLLKRYGGAKKK